ncbi:DoxX family protein [Neisseriaceae bacterium TC5R-5]|nr:DoxX family protein [Neisseriaceae bacterium TC5R-5]
MNFFLSLHAKVSEKIDGLGLILLRFWVGQEFLQAGYKKLSAGLHAPDWFAGLDFPFPLYFLPIDINWVMAGLGEVVLSLALILGLCSRLSAAGLLFITYVAIYTVHFDLGWAGWSQIETGAGLGFKLPAMLAVMLFVLITQGAGKYSLDAIIYRTRSQHGSK